MTKIVNIMPMAGLGKRFLEKFLTTKTTNTY